MPFNRESLGKHFDTPSLDLLDVHCSLIIGTDVIVEKDWREKRVKLRVRSAI